MLHLFNSQVSRFLSIAGMTCLAQVVLAADLQIQAVPGVPFGVGRIMLTLPGQLEEEIRDTSFLSITEANGRVFYPAIRLTRPLGLLREIIGAPPGNERDQLHIHFLFTGSDPLEISLRTPAQRFVNVTPSGAPRAYQRLMRAWWLRYKAVGRKQRQEGDYSPVVETYLTTMLAQRLGLPLPDLEQDVNTGASLSLLLGTEKLRLQLMRDSLTGRMGRDEATDQQVPPAVAWEAIDDPQVRAHVTVEPIAQHVPRECFYMRFAQFPNYLWLRRLLEEYGGDLSRMVALRGTDARLNARVEQQLGLKESVLARVLGSNVISDVALIGRDTFLREGAAIGILFEAKNDLLAGDLQIQRERAVKELADDGATMRTIRVQQRDISFASTPDHRLRSFYVQDGKYHLVTNCQAMATRFLECGRGIRTLGDSDEFHYARSLMPLAEDNTIFVYLSRAFFEGLLSPQYQIELSRRLLAATDAELMQLAGLAARAEGYGNASMDELVKRRFLTTPVDRRPDGSVTRLVADQAFDSHRGARGTFLPIPDMALGKVTPSELARFRRLTDYYQRAWRHVDPVLVGLRRTALNDTVERVQIEARMLPLNTDKYGLLADIFGPPNKLRVRTPEDDIVSMQAFVDGGSFTPSAPPYHMFFGIRDAAPRANVSTRRLLKSLQVLRTAPAYLGAWPNPGLLDRFGLHGQPEGDGYRRMLLGLYRLVTPTAFSLLSFDRDILAEVAPRLSTEEVEDSAQVRIHIGDIKSSKFGQWANELDFQRAWETSVGNVHLLHVLTQQLKVPMADSKRVAESLLDASLVCPLGGEYELVEQSLGRTRWSSSVWLEGKQEARAGYVSPLMNWLRGLDATATIEDEHVVAQGVLDIQRSKPDAGGIKLPLFDFLSGTKSKTQRQKQDTTQPRISRTEKKLSPDAPARPEP